MSMVTGFGIFLLILFDSAAYLFSLFLLSGEAIAVL